ncbi:hypothetical protein Tco_1212426 [Tanacetum coccineum]
MAEPGFRAYWSGSERVIPDKGYLRDYWMEISSDKDFLGPVPSYVHIRDPVRRLCHGMIVCSIFGRGQGAEKVTGVDLFYLRTMDRGTATVLYLLAQLMCRWSGSRFDTVYPRIGYWYWGFLGVGTTLDIFQNIIFIPYFEYSVLSLSGYGVLSFIPLWSLYLFHPAKGRKSGARLTVSHFIGRLAAHFGLVSDQGLRGLSLVVSELPVIDLHDLGRLKIYARFGDTWAWVAPRPERQQAAAAGAPAVKEGTPAADEGAQAIPAPVQAPQPPPPTLRPRTMSQRIDRLEEEASEHLTAPLSAAHDYPIRGVSDPGQAMPAPSQPLGLMTDSLDYYLLWTCYVQ